MQVVWDNNWGWVLCASHCVENDNKTFAVWAGSHRPDWHHEQLAYWQGNLPPISDSDYHAHEGSFAIVRPISSGGQRELTEECFKVLSTSHPVTVKQQSTYIYICGQHCKTGCVELLVTISPAGSAGQPFAVSVGSVYEFHNVKRRRVQLHPSLPKMKLPVCQALTPLATSPSGSWGGCSQVLQDVPMAPYRPSPIPYVQKLVRRLRQDFELEGKVTHVTPFSVTLDADNDLTIWFLRRPAAQHRPTSAAAQGQRGSARHFAGICGIIEGQRYRFSNVSPLFGWRCKASAGMNRDGDLDSVADELTGRRNTGCHARRHRQLVGMEATYRTSWVLLPSPCNPAATPVAGAAARTVGGLTARRVEVLCLPLEGLRTTLQEGIGAGAHSGVGDRGALQRGVRDVQASVFEDLEPLLCSIRPSLPNLSLRLHLRQPLLLRSIMACRGTTNNLAQTISDILTLLGGSSQVVRPLDELVYAPNHIPDRPPRHPTTQPEHDEGIPQILTAECIQALAVLCICRLIVRSRRAVLLSKDELIERAREHGTAGLDPAAADLVTTGMAAFQYPVGGAGAGDGALYRDLGMDGTPYLLTRLCTPSREANITTVARGVSGHSAQYGIPVWTRVPSPYNCSGIGESGQGQRAVVCPALPHMLPPSTGADSASAVDAVADQGGIQLMGLPVSGDWCAVVCDALTVTVRLENRASMLRPLDPSIKQLASVPLTSEAVWCLLAGRAGGRLHEQQRSSWSSVDWYRRGQVLQQLVRAGSRRDGVLCVRGYIATYAAVLRSLPSTEVAGHRDDRVSSHSLVPRPVREAAGFQGRLCAMHCSPMRPVTASDGTRVLVRMYIQEHTSGHGQPAHDQPEAVQPPTRVVAIICVCRDSPQCGRGVLTVARGLQPGSVYDLRPVTADSRHGLCMPCHGSVRLIRQTSCSPAHAMTSAPSHHVEGVPRSPWVSGVGALAAVATRSGTSVSFQAEVQEVITCPPAAPGASDWLRSGHKPAWAVVVRDAVTGVEVLVMVPPVTLCMAAPAWPVGTTLTVQQGMAHLTFNHGVRVHCHRLTQLQFQWPDPTHTVPTARAQEPAASATRAVTVEGWYANRTAWVVGGPRQIRVQPAALPEYELGWRCGVCDCMLQAPVRRQLRPSVSSSSTAARRHGRFGRPAAADRVNDHASKIMVRCPAGCAVCVPRWSCWLACNVADTSGEVVVRVSGEHDVCHVLGVSKGAMQHWKRTLLQEGGGVGGDPMVGEVWGAGGEQDGVAVYDLLSTSELDIERDTAGVMAIRSAVRRIATSWAAGCTRTLSIWCQGGSQQVCVVPLMS